MVALVWDQTGQRFYETGVDHGVLYVPNSSGVYDLGVVWNGLVSVTESPSGAEANPQYADNIKYLNLVSTESFGATIEAFTYPDAFGECDGTATPEVGVYIGQQNRKSFGLAYRTRIGNDVDGTDLGYKLHLIYGALAAPSERAYATFTDSPEAITFSWELTTSPVQVTDYKPTASLTIDSTKADETVLGILEEILFGTAGVNSRLPLPDEVIGMFADTLTLATPTQPTFVQGTNTITIPTVTGVVYQINGVTRTAGAVVITTDTIVTAIPAATYYFPTVIDVDWLYPYAP